MFVELTLTYPYGMVLVSICFAHFVLQIANIVYYQYR